MNQRTGGRYKLPMSAYAASPAPEGTLVIELPNGSSPGSLEFGFNNILPSYTEFKAYFSPSSSDRFTVSPSTGILEPSQTSGISNIQKQTMFTVTCATGQNNARG